MSKPSSTYSILFDIYVLGQRVRRLLSDAMAPGPLRPDEYAVYSVVFEEEAVTPTAMSAELSMPFSTVMDYIRMMEERGHARRIPNPRDGRSYLVVLTAAGMRAHKEGERLLRGRLSAIGDGPPERRD